MIKSFITAFGILAFALAWKAAAQDANNPLLGTWELAKSKAGDAKDYTDAPKQRRELVLYTPNYFAVVNYDTTTKKAGAGLGGRYMVAGEDYREIIEFPAIRGKALTGNTNIFKLHFEGDRFTKIGTLSSGRQISEVWQKVK
jgi:hypothetical protein